MICFARRIERAPADTPPRPPAAIAEHCHYPTLRQALYQFLVPAPPKRVLLPDYVPEGIYAPFAAVRAAVRFYHVPPSLVLDEKELRQTAREFAPDAIVLIHHFGAYIERNVELLRGLARRETLLYEDFAHTIDDSHLPLTGDIGLFSYTKMFGVAEGASVRIPSSSPRPRFRHTAPTRTDRTLKRLLKRQLILEHLLATIARGRRAQSLALRAAAPFVAYYPFLCRHFTSLTAPVSPRWMSILRRIDRAAAATQRKALARRYLEHLRAELLPPIEPAALRRCALYGFPVLVDDRAAFHAHLYRHGVRGQVLCDRWWFDPDHAPSDIYRHHYLLPLNQHLSIDQIDRVIAAVNSYAAPTMQRR